MKAAIASGRASHRQHRLASAATDVQALVTQAEKLWEQDLLFLSLRFPRDAVDPEEVRVYGSQVEALTRESWNEALTQVAAIGWQLNTWSFGPQ